MHKLTLLTQDIRSRLITLAPAVILMASAGCTSTSSSGVQGVPEGVTEWAPVGARTVGDYDYEVIPQPNAFHTMHAGTNNADNVWVATAPRMELDWVSETNFYVPEGPTYDNQGNLYFSPLYPQIDVSLVSLGRGNREAQMEDRGERKQCRERRDPDLERPRQAGRPDHLSRDLHGGDGADA